MQEGVQEVSTGWLLVSADAGGCSRCTATWSSTTSCWRLGVAPCCAALPQLQSRHHPIPACTRARGQPSYCVWQQAQACCTCGCCSCCWGCPPSTLHHTAALNATHTFQSHSWCLPATLHHTGCHLATNMCPGQRAGHSWWCQCMWSHLGPPACPPRGPCLQAPAARATACLLSPRRCVQAPICCTAAAAAGCLPSCFSCFATQRMIHSTLRLPHCSLLPVNDQVKEPLLPSLGYSVYLLCTVKQYFM